MKENSAKKKILIVCPYPENSMAGQRLKYEQFIKYWEEENYSVDISSFMSHRLLSIVHKKGHLFTKVTGTIIGFLKRVIEIPRLRKYDIVYIFLYVNPLGGPYLEKVYRKFSKKIIFDLEDNGFIKPNKDISQKLRSTEKTEYLVQTADHVITSSPVLNNACIAINKYKKATYISSSTDAERFLPVNKFTNDKKIVIGWTGTITTQNFLDLLRPVFIELKKIRDFKLVVIGNFDYSFPEMDLEVIKWNTTTEVADLQKIDIGVYPLEINDWVMGKSGLKAIQYMTIGIPCVATDVSTVQQFIKHGENGFLVKTHEEWINTLVTLIDNPELRKATGTAARQTITTRFSKEVIKHQYLDILKSLS